MSSPVLLLFDDIVMDDLENYCSSILRKYFDCIPLFHTDTWITSFIVCHVVLSVCAYWLGRTHGLV